MARHPQVMIVADEIYEHINYVGKHESLAQFPELKDRVAVINGVSKAYAMTGWRIGYVAAPLWLAKAVNKLQGQYTSGASSIAQKAAEAAYRGSQQCVEDMRVAFQRRRDLITGLLQEIPGIELRVPHGAFYVFPSIKKFGMSSDEFCTRLLKEEKLAVVPGTAFGDCGEGYIRISYAYSLDNLKAAMERLERFISKL